MPPTPPSSLAPGASGRPANPTPRVVAPALERSSASSPPASPRGDLPPSDEAPGEPAPKRKRGRGHAGAKPPAARPAVRARDVLWRLWTIHQILSEHRHPAPTTTDLAKALGTSRRNVKRDIATMVHSLRLPIESRVGNGGGYRFTRRHVPFAAAPASASELVALAVAANMVRAYAGTRLEGDVQAALRRLRLDARAEQALDLDHLADVLSFRGTGFDLLTDLDLFEKLVLAALGHEELRFSYQGTEDEKPRERTVEPWRLFCEDNAWYLRAWDPAAGDFRHFCLGRMETVGATGRRFVRTPKQKKAEASFDESLGAFGGGPLVRAVLRIRGRAAHSVRRRHWHHSQQVRVLGPREVELELRVADNLGLLRFALRWGGDAKILEPASLREKVLEHARAMLAQD